MNGDRWIFPLAVVCFIFIPWSDGLCDDPCELDPYVCDTHAVLAPLGSSVFLPCNFTPTPSSWVSWKHTSWGSMVQLTPGGRVGFRLPKRGRVKAFPNQASVGDFSIRIDAVEQSDLGCYCCVHGLRPQCHQVQLLVDTAGSLSSGAWLLIHIVVGGVVAAFIFLSVCSYWLYYKRTRNNGNTEAVSDPAPQQPDPDPVQDWLPGADNDLVYENDGQNVAGVQDGPRAAPGGAEGFQYLGSSQQSTQTNRIYPDLNQELNLKRVERHSRKVRFHRELFNRLRQASVGRHYYVNQVELNQQRHEQRQERGDVRKKTTTEGADHDYNNPIYNRSSEQLHRM